MFKLIKKRIQFVFELALFAYRICIRQNLSLFIPAVFLGGVARCLHIATFVLILQALVLVVMPHAGGSKARFLSDIAADLPGFSHLGIVPSPSMLVAMLVLLVLLYSLLNSYMYQRLTGRIIKRVQTSLMEHVREESNKPIHAWKSSLTMTTATIKIAEIAGFYLVLVGLIGFISWPVLLICLGLCALAVVSIILLSPKRLVLSEQVANAKSVLASDEAPAHAASDFWAVSEKLRFSNQFATSRELFIIGFATVLLIMLVQLENIEIEGTSYKVFFMVFAIRYAFSYMREFSRYANQILDLRKTVVWR